MFSRLVVGLVVVVACAATVFTIVAHYTPRAGAPSAVTVESGQVGSGSREDVAPSPTPANEPPALALPGPEPSPPLPMPDTVAAADAPSPGPKPATAGPAAPPTPAKRKKPKKSMVEQNPYLGEPDITEPVARQALSLVGADADAEATWIAAINDPRLSRHARSNLIEDLNEDGFTNKKRPTVDDLPLIVSRIVLVEELAPDAMDDVNLDAFLEAYKDLLNMYDRLTQE